MLRLRAVILGLHRTRSVSKHHQAKNGNPNALGCYEHLMRVRAACEGRVGDVAVDGRS